MNTHTPGPWTARIQKNKSHADLGWIIEHSNGRIGWASLAYADTNREAGADDPSREANARLIAAAPDLLAALEGVLRVADRATVEFDAARAAIAKARGQS